MQKKKKKKETERTKISVENVWMSNKNHIFL